VKTDISNWLLEIAKRLLQTSKQLLTDELSPDDVAAICLAESEALRHMAEVLRD
jgi:hypothetical protein